MGGRRSIATAGSWPWVRTGASCSGTWRGARSLLSCRSVWPGTACSMSRETCLPTARQASCDGRFASIRPAASSGSGHPEDFPCPERLPDRRGSNRPDRRRGWHRTRHTSPWLTGRSRSGPLDDCRGVSVSPDGQWLATGSHQIGGVTIWRLPDGRQGDEAAHRERGGLSSARTASG